MSAHKAGGFPTNKGALRQFASGGKVAPPSSILGLYNSAKAMFTDTPEQAQKKADLDAYKANAKAEREAAAKAKAQPAAQISTGVAAGIDGMGGNSMKKREDAAGLAGGGSIKGPRGAMRAMAEKKNAEGSKLEGPGTPTSDSIPATVVNTGEPIKVATGERIVSAGQDAFLLKQANAAGFKTIDEWLEAGTGKPVGPTIKYGDEDGGQKGFYRGGKPDEKTTEQIANQNAMYIAGAQAANPGYSPKAPVQSPMPDYSPGVSGVVGAVGEGLKVAGANTVANAADSTGKTLGALANGNYTGAYGQAMRGAVAAPVALAKDLMDPSLQAAGALYQGAKYGVQGVGNALNTLATGNSEKIFGVDKPVAPVVAAAPAAQPAVNPVVQATQQAPAARVSTGNPQADFLANNPGVAANRQISLGATRGGTTAPVESQVAGGVTRIDAPGRSPLFTNLTGDAGAADNASLQARGPMTAQNQGAMDGIQARQDARDGALAQKMQYDQEVASAQATQAANNAYMARPDTGGYGFLDKNERELENARTRDSGIKPGRGVDTKAGERMVMANQAARKAAEGDMTKAVMANEIQKGQLANTRYSTDTQAATTRNNTDAQSAAAKGALRLQQDKLAADQESAGYDNRAKGALESLQNQLQAATTDAEKEPILQAIRARQGKYSKELAPVRSFPVPGGQAFTKDGIPYTLPSSVYDPDTRTFAQNTQSGGVPNAATAREQALAALKANPANKAEINKRLAAAGYQPI